MEDQTPIIQEPIEIPGFVPFYVRDIPQGCLLNSDTADAYPLIFCGSYISLDKELMIQPSRIGIEGEFELVPYTDYALKRYMRIMPIQIGTIKHLLERVKIYYAGSNAL